VLADQPIREAVDAYLQSIEREAQIDLASRTDRRGRGRIRIQHIHISMGSGCPEGTLAMGQPAQFVFELNEFRKGADYSFTICDHRGIAVANLDSWRHGTQDHVDPKLSDSVLCSLDELPLRAGRYRVDTMIMHKGELQDQVEGAAYFDVES